MVQVHMYPRGDRQVAEIVLDQRPDLFLESNSLFPHSSIGKALDVGSILDR